ncbi:GntR family transcriptional regulator [uncultured Cohaesibacter sp.]|uniref:GntR family transcriptional regulator n=1 Tax=uncultured Cohaesibacter sp. TaxID=1002546 RepID=UPI0029C955A4|nr:GntR family transcriptional regulator [uncultured Cohaesibacter sp.]
MKKNGYQDIKAHIAAMIRSKQWPPGFLLPSEMDLAAQFDCARATVNRALTELADEQIIDRKRKAGSRVRDGSERIVNLKFQFPCREVTSSGKAHKYVSLKREVCAFPEALQHEGTSERALDALKLEGVHYSNDQPFQFEQTWICRDTCAESEGEMPDHSAPCLRLLQKSPYFHGSMTISVARASQEEARYLGVRTGDPLLIKDLVLTEGHGGPPVARMRMSYRASYTIAGTF